MFYWMKRAGMGTGTGSEDVSKAEILRGVVAEKLSTAAQEILAVVERTVAGYEEEIARQRSQMEALLQPRVKLERSGAQSHVETQVIVLSEGEGEELQPSDVEDCGGLGPLWSHDDDEEEEEEEEEEGRVAGEDQQTSSRRRKETQKDPDYHVASSRRSDRRRPGRPRITDTQTHLDLRVRVLEDSQTDVLSKSVFKKFPVQELQVPHGLQEQDFLGLLRSTFPQLAGQKPFELFTTDRTKRLQPLQVTALTPEEIYRRTGKSTLYIRLKGDSAQDPHSSREDLKPLKGSDDAATATATATATTTATTTAEPTSRSSSSPREPADRRRRGRPRLGQDLNHHVLRLCLLEDSLSDCGKVLVRPSVQELRCPRGLQEPDFLHLLRSTFPQLDGHDRHFDVFRSDRSRKLHRLRVKALTPEEIQRSISSSREKKAVTLYLRVKTGEDQEEEEEDLHLLQRSDEVLSGSPAPDAIVIHMDEAGISSSFSVQRREGTRAGGVKSVLKSDEGGAEGPVSCGGEQDQDGGEVCDDDDDWRADPAVRRSASESGSAQTSCKVCGVWYRVPGSLIKHAWSHVDEQQSVCGVCGGHFQSVDQLKGHLRKYQRTHQCSFCGKSFLSSAGLKNHTTLHTGNRPFRCDVCSKTFASMSNLSVHRWIHVDDKPHRCDVCSKAFGLKAQLKAHLKVHTARDRYPCHVCSKTFCDLRSLTRHKATHSGERRYGCEVCGKRFKLANTLKSHEKIHTHRERPYLCHVCCKTFMSNCGLKTHMRTHGAERPFVCAVCGKGFVANGELKMHMSVHTGHAPHGCSQCGRFFKRKTHLSNHVKSHLGIKRFVCGVCGKACSRQEHLTVHMRTHNGERPYQCAVCNRAFTQSHCLKTHMKSHQADRSLYLNAPSP